MTVIFFIYGLSFFCMGLIIALYPKKESSYWLAKNIWFIAAFAILHGLNEWVDMLIIALPTFATTIARLVRTILLPLSFMFLLQFGVKGIGDLKNRYRALVIAPIFLFVLWAIIVATSTQRFLMADIWSRYLLASPGIFLTAYILLLQRKSLIIFQSTKPRFYLTAAVLAFILYGFFAGIIVPDAGFFPATFFNYSVFFDTTRIPVQVFRMLCAMIIAYSMIKILEIFNLETKDEMIKSRDHLDMIVQDRTKALVEMNRDLEHEIAEHKRAEKSLRESEDKFRSIFEQANDGVMIADAETKTHIDANKSMCIMLGYTRDEIVGLSIDDIHPEKDLPVIRGLFEKQLLGEISLATEVPMLRKDRSVFYADINSTRVTLGGKSCLLGIFRNITERKQAEMALRQREKQLADSQRLAHIGSWEHNIETGRVFWSDELFRLLGLDSKKDSEDINVFFEMIHPDDRPVLKKAIDETLQHQIPFSIDYRFVLRDGTIKIIHAQAELLPDESGKKVILSGTAQDFTERKQAEEKLQRSEQFIRSILDTVDESFIVIDRDYHILTANRAYCAQASLPCDEVIGRHCYEISHHANRPCYAKGETCAVRQVFETGLSHTAVHKHSDGTGNILYVETNAFPIKDDSRRVTSVIETINNINERHLLEEERLKTQKLEAIGTLAGGIAHDFNNLLQGVFGYISLARLMKDDQKKSLAAVEEAEKALHLSVRLTNQLLTFSKGGKPVKKRIDLKPLIENAAKLALSGSRSAYKITFDNGLWQVEADEGQLSQVIQNIVLNADQAMPEGGQIEVTAKNIRVSNKTLPQGLQYGNYVAISIKDSGIGISEQYLGKIFDPYFTTKEKGSGLGLATSYSIIKNHNGMINVSSTKHKGSTFFIYIPALDEKIEEDSVKLAIEATAKRTGRVLLMDDEQLVRDVAGELIKALGYKVEFASHGIEAIKKYETARQSGKPFDIVILDLTIRGGMGGVETVQQLLNLDPHVKAIVSSGYSDDSVIANYISQGFKAFLKKPYDVIALGEILNKMF